MNPSAMQKNIYQCVENSLNSHVRYLTIHLHAIPSRWHHFKQNSCRNYWANYQVSLWEELWQGGKEECTAYAKLSSNCGDTNYEQ